MARTFSSNNYITHAAAVVSAAPLTMSVWAYPTASGAFAVMATVGTSGATTNEFRLTIDTDLEVQASANDSAVNSAVTTGTFMSLNAWNHAAAVYVSTTERYAWCNGVKSAVNSVLRSPTGMDTTRIGARANAGMPMVGRLGEGAMWSTNLSDPEVAALARGASPITIRPASLVGYWPIWGVDSPEPDLSGDFRNMTLTGTPPYAYHAPVVLRVRPMFFETAAAAAASYELTDYGFFHPDGVGV